MMASSGENAKKAEYEVLLAKKNGGVDLRRMRRSINIMMPEEFFVQTEASFLQKWSVERTERMMTDMRRGRELGKHMCEDYLAELGLSAFSGTSAFFALSTFLSVYMHASANEVNTALLIQVLEQILEGARVVQLLQTVGTKVPEYEPTAISPQDVP